MVIILQCINMQLLCCTPKTNVTIYVSYTANKNTPIYYLTVLEVRRLKQVYKQILKVTTGVPTEAQQ